MISRICELAQLVTTGHTKIMSAVNRSLAFTLAGLASCDWRTAERFMRGEAVRGLAAERLRAAAAQLGLTLPALAAGAPLMISAAAAGSALDIGGGGIGGAR